MFEVLTSSTFHVKILESYWRTNAAGPCLDTRYWNLCLLRNSVAQVLYVHHCQGWNLALLVLTVPLQVSETSCFFLISCYPTELRMICLKASQCRILASMFDSYEGVRLSLSVQFPALGTPRCVWHGRRWPFVFSVEDYQQSCDLL